MGFSISSLAEEKSGPRKAYTILADDSFTFKIDVGPPTAGGWAILSPSECTGSVDLPSKWVESRGKSGFWGKIAEIARTRPPSRSQQDRRPPYSREICWQFDFDQLKLIVYGAL